jgi:hypothetical protein
MNMLAGVAGPGAYVRARATIGVLRIDQRGAGRPGPANKLPGVEYRRLRLARARARASRAAGGARASSCAAGSARCSRSRACHSGDPKALYDEREVVARDNGNGFPRLRALCAARLPDLSIEIDLAVGAAGGCDRRDPPDQGLNTRLGTAVPNCAIPERQFAEEECNAHGETDEVPRRRKQQENNERGDEEHEGRAYFASVGALRVRIPAP